MSRTKKIIIGIVAVVLVLIFGAMAAISMLVDPNAYKDRIETAAEEALGRNVSIEGDLSLSVFPRLVIETGVIRIENPADFGGGEFASLKQAELNLELMPLLGGQLSINKVSCADLTVLLVKNADGRSNWDFSKGDLDAVTEDNAAEDAPAQSSSEGSGALDIEISSLDLSNADIT